MNKNRNLVYRVKKIKGIRILFRIALRFRIFLSKCKNYIADGIKWLWRSLETTNLTANLTEDSERFLAFAVSLVARCSYEDAIKYFNELKSDASLRDFYKDKVRSYEDAFITDNVPRFGRRLAWYALVRITKPKHVVETGVDKGLGSLVLTAALKMNSQEGFPGFYHGTDINPRAGYFLGGEYNNYGKIVYGDSIESLEKLQGEVDLFISDSDHDPEYEYKEYLTIDKKLTDQAILVSDQGTSKLLNYSKLKNRNFFFFQERATSQWYPTSGIGFSWKDSN